MPALGSSSTCIVHVAYCINPFRIISVKTRLDTSLNYCDRKKISTYQCEFSQGLLKHSIARVGDGSLLYNVIYLSCDKYS